MLDVNNYKILKKYLLEKKIADIESSIFIEPLRGGVSNSVLKISCDKGEFVLKQALPKLKVCSEWLSDVERTNVEKKALQFLQNIIPCFIPQLIHEDNTNFLFIMECAPPTSVTWKSLLMKQKLNELLARRIGKILGIIHQDTHELEEARNGFTNKKFFHQLRIEPFFDFLKLKYPDLKKDIDEHIENCLSAEDALVIGDYSPKNILVSAAKVMVIDFEVTHYGDSSFDLGFLTSHLLLKSIIHPGFGKSFYSILRETVEGYFSYAHFASRPEMERRAVHQLAWLLLARVDGKSPVEYITGEKEKQFIRSSSFEILHQNMKTFKEVTDFLTFKSN